MITDTHIHLTYDDLWIEWEKHVQDAIDHNVSAILNVCLSEIDIERIFSVKNSIKIKTYISAAVGPNDDRSDWEVFFTKISQYASQGDLIAIGETGLDSYRTFVSRDEQLKRFIKHIELALYFSLPLIIHCRGCFDDLIKVLDEFYIDKKCSVPGIVHCFSNGINEIKQIEERGWFAGFGGTVTYKKSQEIQEALMHVSKNNFVIETDAPFLAPLKHRGKINRPCLIEDIAQFIANLRKETFEDVCKQTSLNAKKIFKIN